MVTTATDFGAALTAALQGEYVAQLTGQTYTITSPIVIHVTGTVTGPVGIDGGGATLISQVTNGAPLIQIIADPGVNMRYLTLSNFNIEGNGQEGDGIQIIADGNDRGVYDWSISNVNVEHVGGYGIDVRGSVFEGMVSNSWMSGNALGGAYFAHSAGGGIASALRWFGGGFQNNGGAGLTLDDGARDMVVDDASFVNNHGPGISALWGITAVSDSNFVNNQGAGATFQNYGNFDDNTFSTSGSQTIGMSAYLVNTATLVNNTSTYTGAGSDPTVLANMRGPGGLFVAGDSGPIVTEPSVQTGAILANVLVGTQGVAVPTLAPVTAATTAPAASSTGTGALETALKTAMASGTVVHLTGAAYTVTKSIVINVTASTQGPVGIDLGGAKIISQITDGSPVIEIIVGPGVNLGGLTLSNFMLEGTQQEGDGIKIVADGSDRSVHGLNISNVELEHVGGIELDVLGNVQGTVFDSWMNANSQGGARFANSAHGGVASGLEWIGGGFRAKRRRRPDPGQRHARHDRQRCLLRGQPRAGHRRHVRHHLGARKRLREQPGYRRDRPRLRQFQRRYVLDLRSADDRDRRLFGGGSSHRDRRPRRVLWPGLGYAPAGQCARARNACHRRLRHGRGGAAGGRDRWCRRPHDGDRGARIDQPGSGRERLFPVSGRWIIGAASAVQRRARGGG